MKQFVLATLRAGFRGRLFYAVLVLGLILMAVAFLSGFFSPRQPKTVALDVGFSGLRFSLVLIALVWVQETVGNEITRKTIWFTLSYPVSRSAYLLGRYVGIAILLLVSTLVMALLLWLIVFAAGGNYEQDHAVQLGSAYWIVVGGILVDVLVVAAFALWIATFSTVTALPLALGMSFAVAGRALGAVQDYLGRGADGDASMVANFNPLIKVIQWVLPDLSRLDWRIWSLYSLPPDYSEIGLGLMLSSGYLLVMLAFAMFAFSRREFA